MLMLGLYETVPSASGALVLDATAYTRSCTITTDAHGFESLSATVDRALTDAFRIYDYPLLYVGLSAYGSIVWEGRLEDPTLTVGAQGSGLTIQALGYWRAMSDLPAYIAFWSKSTVEGFRPFTTDDGGLAVVPDRFNFDVQNRIFITPINGSTQGIAAGDAMIGYQTPYGNTRGITGAQFAWELTVPEANWRAAIQNRNADFSGIANPWLFTSGGAGTTTRATHVTFASAQIVNFFLDRNIANAVYAVDTGVNYLKITRLRLVSSTTNEISTTLTANRAAGAGVTATVGSTAGMYVGQELCINSANNPSEIVTVTSITNSTQFVATFVNAYVIGNAVQGFRVFADEIVSHMAASYVSATNADQLSSSTALIQSPGLDLLNEEYKDVSPADVATHLATLGSSSGARYEVGVYEDRKLFFRPINSAARAWYVDATDLQIARTLEALANVVYATYSDASGRRIITANGVDSASIARYGLIRLGIVDGNTTSVTQAGTIRDTALADTKDPKPRATIAFNAIYGASGERYPLWLVRSGDTITIRNLPVGISTSVDRIRTFRITHTSYDAVADTLSVEPELPPPTLEVMLARREEGIRTK